MSQGIPFLRPSASGSLIYIHKADDFYKKTFFINIPKFYKKNFMAKLAHYWYYLVSIAKYYLLEYNDSLSDTDRQMP